MRQWICLLFLLALLPALIVPCFAEDPEESLIAQIDPEDGLSDEALEQVGAYDSTQELDFFSEALRLLTNAFSGLPQTVSDGLAAAGIILAAVFLCSLLSEGSVREQSVSIVGAAAILGACIGNLRAMVTLAEETIRHIREYSMLLLPGLASLCSASGAVQTAGAACGNGMVFLELLMYLCSGLLIPIVWLFLGTSAAEAILGNEMLSSLREFLRWIAANILKWALYLFTGYLAISGILYGSVDALRLRAARVALSGAIPVVGGILSDASESLLTAAGILRNSVGIYGMLAVLALCLSPFLRIALQFLLLRGVTAISGLFQQQRLTSLLERISEGMGLLLGMTGAYSACMLICIVLCLKAIAV